MTPAETRNTAKVIARHRPECPVKDKGIVGDLEQFPELARCRCPKTLLVYYADSQKQRMQSARTTSWKVAEDRAQEIRDSWDPRMQELNRLRAKEEAQQVPLPRAVEIYIADMITRLGDNGTVAMARSLFGHVKSEEVIRNGHFFNWLATIPPAMRPIYIGDITPTLLSEWRNAWKFGSDLTAAMRWTMVRSFFNFCESQDWIDLSPARKMKPLKYAKGNRTAIFSDQQYAAILDAVVAYDPENVPAETRRNWQQRLTTFVELLRWSGMDLIDAVQWRPEIVDKTGVLRYRRVKTGVLATVPLPEHVVALLRSVPPDRDSDPDQPFLTKGKPARAVTQKWQNQLEQLFKLAEITEVRTELGRIRKPHAKMFRDTFAVGHLRNGVPIHSIAKMMGHARTETTERAYLPWVKELEEAHIAAVRKSLASAKPKARRGRKVVNIVSR